MRNIILLAGASLLAAACGPVEETVTAEENPELVTPPELADPVTEYPADDSDRRQPADGDDIARDDMAPYEEPQSTPPDTNEMEPEDGL